MFYIGQECIKHEEINNEYKEFTLCIEKIKCIPHLEIQRYNKGFMDIKLSNIVNATILDNIEKYFSKYYTSFNNTSNINEGILTLGINDNNIITGIPIFEYEKNKDILYKNIYNSILSQKNNIYTYGENNKNISSIDNIELKIITLQKKLLTDNDKLKYIIKSFNNIQKLFKKNQRTINHYIKRHKKWNYLMCLYGIKLTTVLDNKYIKKEFVTYIKKFYNNLILQHVATNTTNTTITIIDCKKRSIILYIENYDFLLKKFKDDMREELKLIKPIKPNLSYKINIETAYFRLTRLISNINSYVINKNITYIIIQIKIKLQHGIMGAELSCPRSLVPHPKGAVLGRVRNQGESEGGGRVGCKKLYYIKDNKIKLQNRILNLNNSPENYNII